ncbi:hypothetical protein ACFVFS_17580 [Kitasatospora sp. NPDC057692]|uniref:hypothetical protein n=1 Tax=Kitasatospora sp. NPDC057692 TaxID=3346215 RepID=UPI0036A87D11
MTGPEHYREAEALLSEASRNFLRGDDPMPALVTAQAHATLALAAATALSSSQEDGMGLADYEAWYATASVNVTTEAVR